MIRLPRNIINRLGVLSVMTGLILAVTGQPSFSGEEMADGYKLLRQTVSEETTLKGRYVEVLDSRMYLVEQGEGDPVIFIHGNPTSSYLWRNVIPYAAGQGRAIAVDLIGMGRSGKSKDGYRYINHYAYLEAFIEELELKNITFVLHDWGAAMGFDYARNNPERVKRLAFMEGVLPPAFPQPSFDAMGEEMGGMFRMFKDPVKGREMIVDNNMFVEEILPNFVNRPLGDKAMEEYRKPYADPSDREPVLEWPRELPIEGEPEDVLARMNKIRSFMTSTDLPVLLLYAEPGVVVPPEAVPWYVQNIKNIETVFVGQGLHYIQEDQPDAIGRALSDWMRRN